MGKGSERLKNYWGVPVGLAVGMLALAACNPSDVFQMTPENLGSGWWGDARNFLGAWTEKVGFGVLAGALNGVWAAKLNLEAWENREEYIGQAEKIEASAIAIQTTKMIGGQMLSEKQAEFQAKQQMKQAVSIMKGVNPVFMTLDVLKETGEGFLAGAIGQVAVGEALKPGADMVTTTLLMISSATLGWQALNKGQR